jgi:hypothetical protein
VVDGADGQDAAQARLRAWLLLSFFFLASNGVSAAYWAAEVPASVGTTLLFKALAIPVLWKLVEAECRPYRMTYPLDMGLFLYAASYLVVPYCFWHTQRWRGLGKFGLVAGLWIVTYVSSLAAAWLAVRLAG